MGKKEQAVRKFIDAYNQHDVSGCAAYLAENVVVRSTYAQQLFPESGGVINGKKLVIDYLEWLFSKMDDLVAHEYELENAGEYFVLRADNNNQTLNYYIHYYVNDNNLIVLLKSNLTQKLNN